MIARIPIFQSAQIREIESLAFSEKITADTLMHRAGNAALEFILRRYPATKSIIVFCGSGNNGGDGYVLATLAHRQDIFVKVFNTQPPEIEPARAAYVACLESNISIQTIDPELNLPPSDLVIDALCGIGLTTPLRGETVEIIKKIEAHAAPVISLDVPSGINSDTGGTLGYAVKADATITFLGLKLGLLTGNGASCAGEISVHNLFVPEKIFSQVPPVAEKIQIQAFADYLQPRLRDWHKGLSGHVLVVGGDIGFGGATRMAAAAALRTGAGLASIATRPENAESIGVGFPEIMCHPIKYAYYLRDLLKKADVIVLGPGMRNSKWARTLFSAVLKTDIPLVIDADGLNLLAQSGYKRDSWILTPHPGEAARLLKTTTQAVQADRLRAAQEINKHYGGVCVLKGAGTLITKSGELTGLCDKGNPGMATAGMGDILSGVIGGLLAQGAPSFQAAELGVYIHAASGDIAARDGERGMIATDLLPHIRKLVNYVNY